MSMIPAELKYTDAHMWARPERDGTLAVGLTDHAQQNLGTILFVTTPGVGTFVGTGEAVGAVEAVSAIAEMYSPARGVVVQVNPAIADDPEQVNNDPYAAWLFKIRRAEGASDDELLDADAYRRLLEDLGA
ncbi:glycine cleavage system protein GcvH [Nocardia gamkensis]|uniref:Glycine cleavage system H protein n=1 Tax=Nocardia gamkensis TaxID=352869 RepID=A0A7X6L4D9_9NOCA|nr:glycine cleavage system protein GcvH [Nocardia gamkensis]NKY27585.1 glycine cleavage system protein GcvH [Nocardia gamkensis]NQE71716.1 Glycine cleavage system H protein 2 [Nocardia gamkensis]